MVGGRAEPSLAEVGKAAASRRTPKACGRVFKSAGGIACATWDKKSGVKPLLHKDKVKN